MHIPKALYAVPVILAAGAGVGLLATAAKDFEDLAVVKGGRR